MSKKFASIVPIAQTEELGCAAIVAALILRYYGEVANAAKLQDELSTLSEDGVAVKRPLTYKFSFNPKLVHPELLRLLFLKHGFFTAPVVGDIKRLRTIASAGTPIVVLYGISMFRQFHYAVLCGFEGRTVLLLDGINGRYRLDERLFLRIWLASGGISFGVASPDRIGFPLTPEEELALATFWHRRGDFGKALHLYIKVATSLKDRRLRAFALNNAARLHYHQDSLDEAKSLLERAVAEDKTFAPALNNLAFLIYRTGGDLNRALELVEEALELDPANRKEYEQTLRQIKEAIEEKQKKPKSKK